MENIPEKGDPLAAAEALSKSFAFAKMGTGVMVWRGSEVLLGRRIKPGADGHGLHALPGGAIEPGEAAVDCAIRETAEEIGIVLDRARMRAGGFHDAGTHVTLYFIADLPEGAAPENLEPNKCEVWEWCDPSSEEFAALSIWDGGRKAILDEYNARVASGAISGPEWNKRPRVSP